jgi:TrmH family RNA methyltransferase
MKAITSADNPSYKRWVRLAESAREVRVQRRTLAEGPHLAEAIHAARHPVEALLLRRDAERPEIRQWVDRFIAQDAPAFELAPALFDRLSPVERGSGLLLLITVPDTPQPGNGDALYLDGIQEPGNAGALLRVAAAAGVRNVLAAPGTVALWSPKVLRGAQGAHFRLGLSEDVAPSRVRAAHPMPWVGATAHAGTPLWAAQLTSTAIGFMVGAEGSGLSEAALAACDQQITIPLASGVESLNVAAAAAVCLFERRRQEMVQARVLPGAR